MTSRHPNLETLAEYASGSLKAGARMVVQIHLGACPACREEVARIESVGGALLATAPGAALAPHALDHALARLEATSNPVPRLSLDQAISRSAWLRLGPGLSIKRLSWFADPGERLLLIRAAGGQALPEHGHRGAERVVVMHGAFEDDQGRYAAGDLSERGSEDRHQPVACTGADCLCLSVTDGALKLSGAARWFSMFLGF